jgi:acetyl esterase/lipase
MIRFWNDGLSYAALLRDTGVAVEPAEFPGQVDAFVSVTRAIRQGNQALRKVADWLERKIG